MSQITQQTVFPSIMRDKLRSVRWRQAAMSAARASAIAATVLIGAMIVAMSLDWCFTIFSTPIRILLTTTSVSLCVIAWLFTGVRPIVKAFGWTRAVSNVDREIPLLEERWRTVASFAESQHQPTSAASKAMLQQVTSEAVAMSMLVRPANIVRAISLRRPMIAATVCAMALVGFMLMNIEQTKILMQRFWSPMLNISATQLKSVTGDVVVPRGQSIEIVTQMTGLQRSSAVMSLMRETADVEALQLKLVVDKPEMLSVVVDVDESFRYRVRAGDGRTEWHSVTAIDFPVLSDVRLTVTPPDYVDEPVTEKTLIPSRLRAIQGSHLELAMKPEQTLRSLTLLLTIPAQEIVDATADGADAAISDDDEAPKTDQKTLVLTRGNDGWYHFETELVGDFLLAPLLVSEHGLTNENPRTCRVEVIKDKAPVARIISPNSETSVSPDETIEISFEAHDDHGIAAAELVVYDTETKDGEEPKILAVKQIPLGDQEMQKHVMGKTQLDLKELGLEEGKSISYAIRVTDNRMLEMDPESVRNRLVANAEKQSETNPDRKDAADSGSEKGEQNQLDAGNENAMAQANQKAGDAASNADSKSQSKGNEDGTPKGGDADADGKNDKPNAENMIAANDRKDQSDDPYAKMIEDGQNRKDSSNNSERKPGTSKNSVDPNDGMKNGDEPEDDSVRTPDDATTDADLSSKDSDPKTQSEAVNDDENMIAANAVNSQDSVNKNGDPKREGQTNSNDPQSPDGKNEDDMPVADNDPKEKDSESEISDLKLEIPDSKSQNFVATSSSGEPPSKHQMRGQRSDEGQKQETDRRKLKIVAKLEAMANSSVEQKQLANPVREKVVQIDKMLEVIEAKLSALYKHEVDESLRGDGFKHLDVQLGDVEVFVSELQADTRETAFEFVGLQMVEIGGTHVTPARDAVFVAIRKPDSGADIHAEEALHHVVSARELLLSLLRKYDSVVQEQELASKIDEAIKMYTVYVEGSQQLMREAQQNFDPLKLQREMAVVEVDQAYLDRLAEVTQMRRDMMSELARILGDDPRLRSRYLDLIKRRRASLRSQLEELALRQEQTAQEVAGWSSVSENQRENYWLQISDLRMDLPQSLAKEAQQFSDRVEKQMPLAINPSQGTAAYAIELSKQIALDARRCDFEVRELRKSGSDAASQNTLSESSSDLVYRIGELAATLDQISFEDAATDGVVDYVQLRLLESRALADQADTWAATATAIESKQYSSLAHLDQEQLTIATELLRLEMLGIEADLAGQFNDENPMPQELKNLTQELHRAMEGITFNQSSATFGFSRDAIERASAQQELALQGFEKAATILDQLRRQTIEVLDQAEVQNPDIAQLRDPTLDEFLANLEREPNIEAQLGIPNRPRNIRVIQETMQWAQDGGMMLGASEAAARTRIEQQMKQQLNVTGESNGKQERPQEDSREMSEEEKKQLAQSKDMQEMLKAQMQQTIKEMQERANDASQPEQQRRQMKEMAEKMSKALEEMKDEQNPEQIWRRMVEADQAKAVMEALAKGETLPDDQWNKLMTTLDDGLGQVGGRTPPEDYRKAIEQYQDRIRKLTGTVGD